jgi:AcrR family transcriptional regulator
MARSKARDGEFGASTRERILEAARKLVARDGWDALTISRVAAEAGVYGYAVHYYFGSKRKLVAVLADGILQEQYELLRKDLSTIQPGERRLHEMMQSICEVGGLELDLLFFETFTSALRDSELRQVIVHQYERLRDLIVGLLDEQKGRQDADHLLTLASLWLMVYDGLAVQRLTDPEDEGYRATLTMFERMVRSELSS